MRSKQPVNSLPLQIKPSRGGFDVETGNGTRLNSVPFNSTLAAQDFIAKETARMTDYNSADFNKRRLLDIADIIRRAVLADDDGDTDGLRLALQEIGNVVGVEFSD